jgi:gas vesicle protein
MKAREKMRVVIALFTGLAVGIAIGVLVAPKSGKETRNTLVETGEKIMEMGKDTVTDVVGKTKDLTEFGKRKIEELKAVAK